MSAKEGYTFEELSVGMAHETHHTITEEDIELFAKVSGDYNPIHMDEEYAKKTAFGQRIALHRGLKFNRPIGGIAPRAP